MPMRPPKAPRLRPPIMPGSCFIIFFIWSNCLTMRFTSLMSTPAPAAMRFFLEGFMMDGLALSSFVMERMIASTRSMAFSSMSTSLSCPMPGIMLIMLAMPPIFLI